MKIIEDFLRLKQAKFISRLKGYSISPRNKFLFVINKDLTETEFYLLFLFWEVLADWDSRHLSYGVVEIEQDVLAYFINWHPSKIRRIINSLINKGFIQPLSNKALTITGFGIREKFKEKSDQFNFYDELKKIINNFEQKNVKNNKK